MSERSEVSEGGGADERHGTEDSASGAIGGGQPRDPGMPPMSFEQLVVNHVDLVWRTLRRLGVGSADVDDATQQVFLIANDKLTLIRPGSERSFLVAVAARVASHARRADQRRAAGREQLSFMEQGTVEDPEYLTLRLQAREMLDQVLEQMPAELRIVFVLFELEDLSVDDIAASLSLPRGTVATRLRRARVVFHEKAEALQASSQAQRANAHSKTGGSSSSARPVRHSTRPPDSSVSASQRGSLRREGK